jgi:hypothetical protein
VARAAAERARDLAARRAAVEAERAAAAARRARAAEDDARREEARASSAAVTGQALRSAGDQLSRGEQVSDDALAAQAAALAEARALARESGDQAAAHRADLAAGWVDAAREALARGDLHQARVAHAQAEALGAGAYAAGR